MKAVPTPLACYSLIAFTCSLLASPDQPIVEPVEVIKTYAQGGDPTAQFNLAIHYSKGEQAAKDIAAAVNLYKQSAQAGFAPAQFNLGVLYANGKEVPHDDKEAVKWLTLAAQQGTFDAQTILVEFFTEGRGMPKNPVAALAWDFIARRTLELRHEKPAGEPPHPAILRKDGSAELVMKDGKTKILHPDGGEETVRADGNRVIAYNDGKTKTVAADGTEIIKHTSGFEETKYPDGRKGIRDPKGTVETTYPDGRKSLEGTATDKYGRTLRITESFNKDGKRTGRIVGRDNVTIRENADGPYAVETVLDDQRGVRVKLTEEVQPGGKIGQRKLTRLDTGEEPKGAEVWTIRRSIEPGDGTSVLVEESYSSLGLGEQQLIKKGAIAQPSSDSVARLGSGADKMTGRTFVQESTVVQMHQTVGIGRLAGEAPVSLFKEPVNLDPMLKKLEELEIKSLHFAGATEADWARAKAYAAAYFIPLGSVPQKQGASPSWLTGKLLSGNTLPVVPFQPATEDFSRKFPFGFHGRDVIKERAWKHAQTPHFIVHFIEDSDARLTMQFIEGAYHVIVNLLGFDSQRGDQKGHVFLFPGEKDWQAYLAKTQNSAPLGGFAYKNELLLPALAEHAGREESIKTLCHEVTHAILSRFYPAGKPPLWLNEGFAEYIAARTIATKRGHPVDKYMSVHANRPMKVDEVFQRIRYGVPTRRTLMFGNGGSDPAIPAFYANAAWCVRTLCEKLPAEGLPKFFNAMIAGNSPDAAFQCAYGAKCPDAKMFAAMANSWQMPKSALGGK